MQAMVLAQGTPDEPDEPDQPGSPGSATSAGTPATKGKQGMHGTPAILTPDEIRSFVLGQLDLPVNEGDETMLQTPKPKDTDNGSAKE